MLAKRWFALGALCLLDGVFSPASVLADSNAFYNLNFVQDLSLNLHLRHKFNGLITFSDNRKLVKPLVESHYFVSLERFLAVTLRLPLIIYGLQRTIPEPGIIARKTFVFCTVRNLRVEQESMFKVVHKMLEGRHDLRILFILNPGKPHQPSMEEIYLFFRWCWRYHFINVALTYQRIIQNDNDNFSTYDELFSYTPFPKISIQNVTDIGVAFKWEAVDVTDVKGYEFRVPVFQDYAYAFLLPNGKIYGIVGKLVAGFIEHCNGTLRVERTPDVNRFNYHNRTLTWPARGIIDIGVHPFTQLIQKSDEAEGIIVMSPTKTCLMVPVLIPRPLNRFMSFVVLNNGVLLVVILPLLMLGWQLLARNCSKGFFLAFVLFSMQPVNENLFRRLSNAYKMVHMAILLSFFILWNNRTGALTRAISLTSTPQQIHTVADFLRSPLRIMVTKAEVEMYFKNELLPKALEPRLLVVNSSTLMQHRNSLNTSYAYCASEGAWNIASFQQSRLNPPLFQLLSQNFCTSSTILHIPMGRNSPFRDAFFRFYMQSRLTGVFERWRAVSFKKAAHAGFIQVIPEDNSFVSMNVQDYMVFIKGYWICIGICVLSLICEIIWKNRVHLRFHW
ncbi:uncharacterized protein Dmoj_GI24791 [Drosophila mojavensis]|uniref:Ionotropic glutamate receptor L-glutamate and glycine-binding domain-containing protein n=1 Tax=Drosophila mojavensis TaxID=7230 RepID=B4K7M9_DROMO|nr:uncharacterized protein Dmoj_GI24791 [Drosophila mojavensis]